MIDISNKYDILNSSTRGTDFLYQQYPFMRSRTLTVPLVDAENGFFIGE